MSRLRGPMMMGIRGLRCDERGQALPLLALMFVGLLVGIGIAVDVGLTFIEKARLQTAADAAALAGSRQLGNSGVCDPNAKNAARDYLEMNGYDTAANSWSAECLRDTYNKLTIFRLTLSRVSDTAFMRLIGIRTININATAASQYATRLVDVILSVDTTGSMNQDNNGDDDTRLEELQDAAKEMVQDLDLDPSDPLSIRAGLVRFDGEVCYDNNGQIVWQWDVDPTTTVDDDPNISCVDDTGQVSAYTTGASLNSLGLNQPLQPLTRIPGQVISEINHLEANGGSGTKAGAGVTGADAAFEWTGPRANANRFLVLMTDGCNQWEPKEIRKSMQMDVHAGLGHDTSAGGSCSPNYSPDFDAHSIAAANALKAKGVEIYTIGFEVPGTDSCPSATLPGDLSTYDQVLIAVSSSTPGSCDHYFKADEGDLADVFNEIGRQIGGNRLIQ